MIPPMATVEPQGGFHVAREGSRAEQRNTAQHSANHARRADRLFHRGVG